jgi:hypothetical protein
MMDTKMSETELPEDLQQLAFEYYGETAEKRRWAIDQLKQEILKLPSKDRLQDLSDRSLIRFIRGCKYNLEKAVKKTVAYQQFRDANHDWFQPSLEEIEKYSRMCKVVKEPDAIKRRIVIIAPHLGWDDISEDFLQKYPSSLTRYRIWFLDQLTFDPYSQLQGLIILMTFEGLSLWNARHKSNQMAKSSEHGEVTKFMTLSAPLRLRQMYIFQEPWFFTVIWRITSFFLNEKTKKKFIFGGGNYNILYQLKEGQVDAGPFQHQRHIIPSCLGGEGTNDLTEDNWIIELIQQIQQQSSRI